LEYPRHIFVPVRNWISNDTCHCFFCVQWVKMRSNYSFGWYLWNCWPSISFYSRNIIFCNAYFIFNIFKH
jgi:hypothetical protein